MHKRRIAIAAAMLAVGLIVGIGPAQAKKHGPPPITVRGGYINDIDCVPMGVSPTADTQVFNIECTSITMWNGDFTGRTVIHLFGTADTSGRFAGSYDEFFIGTYAGDHSYGGLHTKGTFTINENGQFVARADIIGGSCDWAGSSGSMAFDGHFLNGGYVAQWKRPAVLPASDPTCNPVDRLPE